MSDVVHHTLRAAPLCGSAAPALRQVLPAQLPALRARALKLCRNGADAEDVLHDAVERALRFEASFREGTNLRAWLQQVLYSVFVTRCRRRGRELRALRALGDDPCGWPQGEPPAVLQCLTPRLDRALAALPQQYAATLRLVDLGECSYADAAEQLGVPVGTVMSRLFRGRRLMAAALTRPVACAA